MIRLLPLNESFLPNVDPATSSAVEAETWSWPLNQKGVPAASLSPEIFWPVGEISGSIVAAARREVERVEADRQELDLVALVDRDAAAGRRR